MDIVNKIEETVKCITGHIPPNPHSCNDNNSQKANILYIYITRGGTYIDVSRMLPAVICKIKGYFTLTNKNIMGHVKKTTLWYIEDFRMYIPRFGAILLRNKKFFEISLKNEISPDNRLGHISYVGKFEGNQKLVFDEIMKNYFSSSKLLSGHAGLILNLKAGMGKSFLAMALIGYLKCRTLIVVHNKTILQQWVKILKEYVPGAKIGVYYGLKKTYGDIIIGLINSLILPDITGFESPRAFYDTIDFVILDEVHQYCSNSRRTIYDVCQSPYMIGLSATPDEREDGLDKVNKWFVGPILKADALSGYSEQSIPFKGFVHQIKYHGPSMYTQMLINEKLGMVSIASMINQISADPYRTRLIAKLTYEQYKNNHNIFVFADRRDYLISINEELKKISLQGQMLTTDKDLESIRLVGGSTENEMKSAIEDKCIILTTYQYMSTGCSIPKMNCVVLATPRKSGLEQIIKRIFRLGSDYTIVRKIIDVVDWKTTLKNQWYKRKSYYTLQKFAIQEYTYQHTDV